MLRTFALGLAALVLVGCSAETSPDDGGDAADGAAGDATQSESSEQPRTEAAAEEVAQEQADRYAAGDFGGAWDMWAEEAQETISRDDYVELGEACLSAGLPLEVSDVRLEGDDRAVVRLGVEGFQQAYTMRYEDGAWRWMPTDRALQDYEGGVDQLIRQMNAKGQCVPQ